MSSFFMHQMQLYYKKIQMLNVGGIFPVMKYNE